LGYFNTHPVLAGCVLGAVARLEERRAQGEPVSTDQVEALKRALASPLAALGDPLFWVTLRPLAGLLGVLGMGLFPIMDRPGPDLRVLLCPLIVLLTYNAVALPLRVSGVARGYVHAEEPLVLLRTLRLREWRVTLERIGAFAYGGVAALTAMLLLESAAGESRGLAVHVAPLVLGAIAGLGVLGRWPGRVVEAALTALGLAALLSIPF
jgi:mannose/fructose/N-acetylgalactosamine-specific phosphotransferase system component IID